MRHVPCPALPVPSLLCRPERTASTSAQCSTFVAVPYHSFHIHTPSKSCESPLAPLLFRRTLGGASRGGQFDCERRQNAGTHVEASGARYGPPSSRPTYWGKTLRAWMSCHGVEGHARSSQTPSRARLMMRPDVRPRRQLFRLRLRPRRPTYTGGRVDDSGRAPTAAVAARAVSRHHPSPPFRVHPATS
jgi:hypothetical protein